MGFFESRRRRKEIERLEYDLCRVRSQIKNVEKLIEDAKSYYQKVQQRTTKAYEDELETIECNCGEEARKKAERAAMECERELIKLGFRINVGNATPIIDKFARTMPGTADAMRGAIQLRIWMANPASRSELDELMRLSTAEAQIEKKLREIK